MGDSLDKKAFEACNAPYSEENEEAAVQAVKNWLASSGPNKVEEYKSPDKSSTKSMLLVASENGYPKVVRELLKDKELVKVELDDRAEELKKGLLMSRAQASRKHVRS